MSHLHNFMSWLKINHPKAWCILAILILYPLIVVLTCFIFIHEITIVISKRLWRDFKNELSYAIAEAKYNLRHTKRITPDIVKTWKGGIDESK